MYRRQQLALVNDIRFKTILINGERYSLNYTVKVVRHQLISIRNFSDFFLFKFYGHTNTLLKYLNFREKLKNEYK